MSMKIECAGYKQNSCDDGPGIRGAERIVRVVRIRANSFMGMACGKT